MSDSKYIYSFGKITDGDAKLRNLLGGKGANLAEMAKIGLPVPPGFTITTEVCTYFNANFKSFPQSMKAQMEDAISIIENQLDRKFGDASNPLLFSVRSGARESMPGMMDTILNLGLNDKTVEGLAIISGNPRFAYDCYRRFIQMYGDVVMGVQSSSSNELEPFDAILETIKDEKRVKLDSELNAENLKELIDRYKALIINRTGNTFPQEVEEQLDGAISAVFGSWNNERAIVYRQKYNIPFEWGTAVNVQAMVFGNMGDTSSTGVAFTRDPANGQKVFYGEYLINAQGEDVVAGIRTPKAIAKLEKEMPEIHSALVDVCNTLENHFKDMQDFEFTVEDNKLYMLQTRNGKRTGLAAVRIANEMVAEELIDKKEAVRRIPADSISSLLTPVFDEADRKKALYLSKGLPAGPGAASGKIVFSAEEAEYQSAKGYPVILCRTETSPEDLKGMLVSQGILTSRGGVSSHAALVARQLGKVCVCGAHDIVMDYVNKTLTVGNTTLKELEDLSMDGTTGEVFSGSVETSPSEVIQVLEGKLKPVESYTYQMFANIMTWSDEFRTMKIRTNSDSPAQAKLALAFGAQGIGLCRTEHMFFEGDRIDHMREMILSENKESREKALLKLLPYQKEDFTGLFRSMNGLPVTIRLLDPPLHEFLPHDDSTIRSLAEKLNIPQERIIDRVKTLHEQNPMLGHRGCRLGISYPEITRMQARAIFEAAATVLKEGLKCEPEVMVPLVGFKGELANQIAIIREQADTVSEEQGLDIKYMIGTMIEIPRAALVADEIAEIAEFFSFGTNDLTQTTLGMSRDDSGTFLPGYSDKEIVKGNPFASIDQEGVGKLVKIGAEGGRKTRPNIKLGICGEHGGDPESIMFCNTIPLSYVSCSPNRVPIARLAAAQAAIIQNKPK